MSETKECPAFLQKFAPIYKLFELKIKILNLLSPLSNLAIRLVVGYIFWKSGVLKLPQGFLGIGQGNWESTILLFEYEHPVPGLPPELAAYLGTTSEILFPILLLFGFGARIAALGLMVMTLVIQYTYLHSFEHYIWMAMLSVIIFQGAGKFSVDYLIRKKTLGCDHYKEMADVK